MEVISLITITTQVHSNNFPIKHKISINIWYITEGYLKLEYKCM
jgi:hypothetical protein